MAVNKGKIVDKDPTGAGSGSGKVKADICNETDGCVVGNKYPFTNCDSTLKQTDECDFNVKKIDSIWQAINVKRKT